MLCRLGHFIFTFLYVDESGEYTVLYSSSVSVAKAPMVSAHVDRPVSYNTCIKMYYS